MIGPARAVRRETRTSAATGRTAIHLALAKTDPLETRVLCVEIAVSPVARQGRTRIGVPVHPRGRPARATATSRRGLTEGRVRRTPDRRVRAIAVVPMVRIVDPAPLIPALPVRATASGLRDWFGDHVLPILGRPVRDTAVVPRARIVGRARPIRCARAACRKSASRSWMARPRSKSSIPTNPVRSRRK